MHLRPTIGTQAHLYLINSLDRFGGVSHDAVEAVTMWQAEIVAEFVKSDLLNALLHEGTRGIQPIAGQDTGPTGPKPQTKYSPILIPGRWRFDISPAVCFGG